MWNPLGTHSEPIVFCKRPHAIHKFQQTDTMSEPIGTHSEPSVFLTVLSKNQHFDVHPVFY